MIVAFKKIIVTTSKLKAYYIPFGVIKVSILIGFKIYESFISINIWKDTTLIVLKIF